MKILVGFLRIFVGIFFIISGLIKLNDPVGFSFKLQDYFAPEVLNLEFLVPYALLLAVVVVIAEVLLGVMLIVGYARKLTLWSLLLMILFFTFLTFYSAYFEKVTDCGCFGDAMPLDPWESFWKDIVLLAMILIIFFGRKHLQQFFTKFTRSIIVFTAFAGCLLLGYHVLQHLPVKDFRAYKIGTNIMEGMSTPEDAPKPVYEYNWKFNVNGEEKVITNRGADPKQEGELISVETNVIQKGYEPPIHDFSIERAGEDYTASILSEENVIVVIAYNLDNTEKGAFSAIRETTNEALKKGYKVIGMSASSQAETEKLVSDYRLNFDFYFCDMTALKTIVRSNPGILALEKGTIVQKLHYNDIDQLVLNALPSATPSMDFGLKRRLDSIAELDQRYRQLAQVNEGDERIALGKELGLPEEEYTGDIFEMMTLVDASNMAFVEKLFKSGVYPGKSVVGEPTNTAAWFVLQHNPDKIPTYLPLIRKAGEDGEIPFRLVAMMEDRYLMNQNKPQIYGTQGSYRDGMGQFIWPIESPETVNEKRLDAGYTQTVEEYSKLLFGEDFEYKALTMDDVNQ